MPRKIGIIGYGKLGKFLVNHILQQFDLELSFVWCPNPKVLIGYIDSRFILKDLSQFRTRNSDLIIDLSLPEVAKNYGALFLQEADYMSLKIIIKKQPSHLSVTGDLKKKNDQVKKEATILFNGNVRSLYPLAPLHIRPMIVTALAAHTLGFDNVEAEIISDPK
ncbi:nadX [Acanthosepion pharaonis]|uniref:NadX n=1 Tax=Acanthosepion pharaonis TaxID=158019 RepID=A0A812C8Y1_ACAPH|nr:nadX [Sepia pharaonis]